MGDFFVIIIRMEIRKNINLSQYCTYRTGGNVDFLCICKNLDDLEDALFFAEEKGLEHFILGGGSNVLFSDDGFRGIVIVNKIDTINFEGERVSVGSGYSLAKLISETAERGLSGLEFLAGIPGTVGGAVFGNAGSWDHSISEAIKTVKIYTPDGDIVELLPDELGFNYRKSNIGERNLIILEVDFRLKKDSSEEIKEKIAENLKKKAETRPKGLSCGSFFKNSKEHSAGELIEKVGLKGEKIGSAQISEKHANFIINLGNATSSEIYQLAQLAKRAVKEKFGIELEEEIKLIGGFR